MAANYCISLNSVIQYIPSILRRLGSSQVKSSSEATRPRGEHPDPNFVLPSSLRRLWRGLVEVGR